MVDETGEPCHALFDRDIGERVGEPIRGWPALARAEPEQRVDESRCRDDRAGRGGEGEERRNSNHGLGHAGVEGGDRDGGEVVPRAEDAAGQGGAEHVHRSRSAERAEVVRAGEEAGGQVGAGELVGALQEIREGVEPLRVGLDALGDGVAQDIRPRERDERVRDADLVAFADSVVVAVDPHRAGDSAGRFAEVHVRLAGQGDVDIEEVRRAAAVGDRLRLDDAIVPRRQVQECVGAVGLRLRGGDADVALVEIDGHAAQAGLAPLCHAVAVAIDEDLARECRADLAEVVVDTRQVRHQADVAEHVVHQARAAAGADSLRTVVITRWLRLGDRVVAGEQLVEVIRPVCRRRRGQGDGLLVDSRASERHDDAADTRLRGVAGIVLVLVEIDVAREAGLRVAEVLIRQPC